MSVLPDLFPGFEARTIRTRGADIFLRLGGEGPPLALLHGYPQTHAMWHRLAPALAQRFKVVIPDLRGYGASSMPADATDHSSYSKRAMAEDVIDVMEALGYSQFAILAHDRGARAAYRLALDHPERPTRLVLLDIIPTYDMWHRPSLQSAMRSFHWTFLAQPAPMPEKMIGTDPIFWLENKLKRWNGTGELSVFAPEALVHYRDFFTKPERIHATCEDYRAGATYDLKADEEDRAAGRKITCPVLALWGSKGIPRATAGPLAVWQDWCSNVQGAPIESGHFLAEENPGATLAAVMPFLSESI